MPPEAALRRALGRLTVVFGVLHLAPVAFVWLSSLGPASLSLPARVWGLLFYGHFIALTACGLGLQGARSARTKVFHGGPMIDFVIGVTAFMVLESVCASALRRGAGPSWPALLPGLFLIGFCLRLTSGAPLLRS